MHYDKKQLEILIMEYFRQTSTGFPKAKVTPDESPDFIIHLNNRNKIGIELTRLHPTGNTSSNGINDIQTVINEDIVAMACDLFSRNSPLKLFVKVLFSAKTPIIEERKIAVAVLCSILIGKAVQNKNSLSFFNSVIAGDELPAGIEKILVINHPVLQTHVWERANNLGVSTNVVDDISQAIRKKDEKLRIYHKKQLNLYWLLITTDRLRGVKEYNLPQQIDRHEFRSLFQHVFLFDLMKQKIYQIV